MKGTKLKTLDSNNVLLMSGGTRECWFDAPLPDEPAIDYPEMIICPAFKGGIPASNP